MLQRLSPFIRGAGHRWQVLARERAPLLRGQYATSAAGLAEEPEESFESSIVRRVVKGQLQKPGLWDLQRRSDDSRSTIYLKSPSKKRESIALDEVFLRDSCRCPQCVDPHSGNKKFYTADIPASIKIKSIQLSTPERGQDHTDQVLTIQWLNDVPGYAEHETKLELDLLVGKKSSMKKTLTPATASPRIRGTWNPQQIQNNIKTYSYADFAEEGMPFYEAAYDLYRSGLIFIKDVPESDKSIEHIANRIGPLKNTFYGWTWDVKDKPQAENVAYTSGYLGFHMDLLYMKQPPGIQLLHCIRSSEEGGDSIFSDAFLAASIMRRDDPDLFQLLSDFQVPYHYNANGNHYYDTKPTFDTGIAPGTQYIPRRFDAAVPTLLNVNYSPPFQAPFKLRSLRESARLRDYHRAIQRFQRLISSPNLVYERRLQPGECVIFLNRRILHGRKAFTSAGERWLKGAYLDIDPFDSLVRRLHVEGKWMTLMPPVEDGELSSEDLANAQMV